MSTHSPATVAQGPDLGAAAPITTAQTASAAAAAQAKAEVEAAYIVALQRPRDWMQVRERLLKECQRPRFAESARYSLPRSQWDPETRSRRTIQITGPSIRFAESALRATRNIRVGTYVLHDDDEKRVCRVVVTDLEANTPLSADFVVEKTVERKQLRRGEQALRERVGADGSKVYVVASSESDISMKQNAAASRARRNLILQLLPGDILEEAMEALDATLQAEHAKDPKAATRKLVDGFGRLGVRAAELAEYLGHSADEMTPQEFAELRDLGVAIRDGATTWADAMEAKREGTSEETAESRKLRADALAAVAAARMAHPDRAEEALQSVGVAMDAPIEALPLETLVEIADRLQAAKKPAKRKGKKNDTDEEG